MPIAAGLANREAVAGVLVLFAEQTKHTAGSMAGRTGDAMEPGKAHSISKNTRS